MRQLAAMAAVMFSCVVSVALAQDAPTDGRFSAQWDRRPNAGDFARRYPSEAVERGIPGLVHLCCSPSPNRRLDCRVGFEWPQDQGFGRATLGIASEFRMSPESYAEFQATSGAWIQLPIQWRVGLDGREMDIIAARIRDGTRGLCRPAAPPA